MIELLRSEGLISGLGEVLKESWRVFKKAKSHGKVMEN